MKKLRKFNLQGKKYRKAGYVQRRVQKDERGIFLEGL